MWKFWVNLIIFAINIKNSEKFWKMFWRMLENLYEYLFNLRIFLQTNIRNFLKISRKFNKLFYLYCILSSKTKTICFHLPIFIYWINIKCKRIKRHLNGGALLPFPPKLIDNVPLRSPIHGTPLCTHLTVHDLLTSTRIS